MKLKEIDTIEGCYKCFYNRRLGAKLCKFSSKCFADKRLDKRSVIFVMDNTHDKN